MLDEARQGDQSLSLLLPVFHLFYLLSSLFINVTSEFLSVSLGYILYMLMLLLLSFAYPLSTHSAYANYSHLIYFIPCMSLIYHLSS